MAGAFPAVGQVGGFGQYGVAGCCGGLSGVAGGGLLVVVGKLGQQLGEVGQGSGVGLVGGAYLHGEAGWLGKASLVIMGCFIVLDSGAGGAWRV